MDKDFSIQSNDNNIEFYADYELVYSDHELDELDIQLSQQEEQQLKELAELKNKSTVPNSFLKDVIEAAKQGALNYLDSFTDTNDVMDSMKRPAKVSQWDNTEIDKKSKPATPHQRENRTLGEAGTSPFDKNVNGSCSGMSEVGRKRFEKYAEAYSQRTKSIRNVSTSENTTKTSDKEMNLDSLAGLRGYRIGPVVPVPTMTEAKTNFDNYKANGGPKEATIWLKDENFKTFDQELQKQFGFKTRTEATKWRTENHLTIHEGPDGMFLVPTDVHDAVSHSGYRSMMSKHLMGKATEEEVSQYIKEEKKAFVKHEAKVRAAQAVKGVGMAVVKDLLKSFVLIVGEETYNEFKRSSKDSFVERIKTLIQNTWNHFREKCAKTIKELWDTIKNGVKGAVLSEVFRLLNDFVFKTAKNIFKIIRTMWGSIIKAIKVIFSSESSWGERVFEAVKILTSGLVGVVGFSLNELLEKSLMSIGIPFASFISECLSGLFAGIMSAIVLVVFDNIKGQLFMSSPYVQQNMMEMRLVSIDSARINISSLKTTQKIQDAYIVVGKSVFEMLTHYGAIKIRQGKGDVTLQEISDITNTNEIIIKQRTEMVSQYTNDNDF